MSTNDYTQMIAYDGEEGLIYSVAVVFSDIGSHRTLFYCVSLMDGLIIHSWFLLFTTVSCH